MGARRSVKAHPSNPCLGYRPVVAGSPQPYEWQTYQQARPCTHMAAVLERVAALYAQESVLQTPEAVVRALLRSGTPCLKCRAGVGRVCLLGALAAEPVRARSDSVGSPKSRRSYRRADLGRITLEMVSNLITP